jgi:hypothetical protein
MFLSVLVVHVSGNNERFVALLIHAVPAAYGGGGSFQPYYNTGGSRFKVLFRPVTYYDHSSSGLVRQVYICQILGFTPPLSPAVPGRPPKTGKSAGPGREGP